MKKYQLILLFLLIFLAPAWEAVTQTFFSETFRGFSPFPALMVSMLLFLPQVWVPLVVMIAAAWRDIVLLEPYASTLLGAGLSLAALALVKSFLTNRSLATDMIIIVIIYGFYILGETMSLALARFIANNNDQNLWWRPWPFVLNLIFVLACFFFWRWRRGSLVSYNF